MRIKGLFLLPVVLLMLGVVFTSCEKNNDDDNLLTPTTFDCESLEQNIGAACTTALGAAGTVNDDCECQATSTADCQVLDLDWFDACTTASGEDGVVNGNCECVLESTLFDYDCDQGFNIGEPCQLDGSVGVVVEGCECEI